MVVTGMFLALVFPHFLKSLLDNAKNALFRVPAFVIGLARRLAEQQGYGFLNTGNRVYRKLASAYCLYHFAVEHQVLHIGGWYNDTLSARKPALKLAGCEKAFNFLIHTADGLNFAKLVDRPRDRQILSYRNPGE